MRIDRDAREADGEMRAGGGDRTDLGASPAAAANRPPAGDHDIGGVPEWPPATEEGEGAGASADE